MNTSSTSVDGGSLDYNLIYFHSHAIEDVPLTEARGILQHYYLDRLYHHIKDNQSCDNFVFGLSKYFIDSYPRCLSYE